MKVLIIGGTGTISKHVCDLLVKEKHIVTVVNRGINGTITTGVRCHIVSDINNTEKIIQEIIQEYFDVVIDFISFDVTNVLARYDVFKGKTNQYVFISSATVYRADSSNITEKSPVGNPYYTYAQNKLECENVLLNYVDSDLYNVTIVRPSHTFDNNAVPLGIHGKNGSWQNIKRMIEGKKVIIHGDGNGLWAMMRSEDFARALLGVLGNPQAYGEIYQITSDESLSWNRIYSIVAEELGVKLECAHIPVDILVNMGEQYDLKGKLLGDKSRSLCFCNDKIKSISPGYHQTFSMEEGIRNSVRNVMKNQKLHKCDNEYERWCDLVIEVYEREIVRCKIN